jgi:hypothetical protein
MAPWPHVEFKASRSLRIQWPFNCCNISLLSWHWSILIFPEIQCSQGHGDPFTGEAASLSSMSILEVLLKPKWVVFERCWKCISIILSMYWFVYSNIRYTYVYIYSCMDIFILMYRLYCCEGKTSYDNTTTVSPDGVGTRIFHTASGWRDKAEDRMKNVISFMGRYWKWCLVSA